MSIRIYIFMIIWRKNARRSVHAKLCMHACSRFLRVDARTHKNKYPNAEFACHLCRKCADRYPPSEQQRRRPWRWQGLADSNSTVTSSMTGSNQLCSLRHWQNNFALMPLIREVHLHTDAGRACSPTARLSTSTGPTPTSWTTSVPPTSLPTPLPAPPRPSPPTPSAPTCAVATVCTMPPVR